MIQSTTISMFTKAQGVHLMGGKEWCIELKYMGYVHSYNLLMARAGIACPAAGKGMGMRWLETHISPSCNGANSLTADQAF